MAVSEPFLDWELHTSLLSGFNFELNYQKEEKVTRELLVTVGFKLRTLILKLYSCIRKLLTHRFPCAPRPRGRKFVAGRRTPDRRGRAVPRLSHPDSRRTCRTVSCLRSIRSTRGNGMMTGLNKEKTDILVECFSNRHTGRKPIRLLLYTFVSLII